MEQQGHLSDLSERVTKTESQLEALTTDVRQIAQSVERLTQTITSSQRANWPLVLSAVTTILAIVVLYVTPFTAAQVEIKSDLRKLADAFVAHVSAENPHRMDQRVLSVDRKIDASIASINQRLETAETVEAARHQFVDERLGRLEAFVVGRAERASTFLDGTAWEAITTRKD